MANLQQIPMSGLEDKENVPLSECKKQDPEEDPQMDKATQKPDIDGFADSSVKSELAIINDDSENLWHFELEGKSSFEVPSVDKVTAESAHNNPFGEHSSTEVEYAHGVIGSGMQPYVIHSHEQGSLDQLHHNVSEGSLDHNLKKAGDKQDSSTADHRIFEGHTKQDINHAEGSENSYITESCTPGNREVIGFEDQKQNMAILQHSLMSGLQDKEKLSLTECEKQDPEIDLQMDKDTRKHAIDGFPDWSRELELEIFSGNKQPSDGYHESMAEKHYRADDLEDLWHCGLESKSSLTAPPVSKEISDEDASGEHNNKEVEYVHGTVGNLGSSMQPYVVHSCEQGSLDQLHNISTDAPQDHDLKQVDDKQDLSTAGHSISAGHSEKEMNKAEESENTRSTENSTPCNGKVVGAVDQEENMANLQELLMSGLQDKEKVLLTEYTSILRNYKNAKRSLTEMEIKNEECLNEMKAMMSELRCANELKDKEIRSLRELLNSSTDKDAQHSGHHINTNTTVSFKSGSFRGHRRIPSFLPVHQRRQSASSIQNYSPKNNANHEAHMEDDASHDTVLDQESIVLGDHRLTNILEMENASPLEDKFRRDIDGLLGENLEFWMKFSTSFQKIQEFQTKHDQLQSEIGKIVNEDKLKVNSGRASDPPAKVESEAIEKQLRELKIDMQVWLEQNAMFKGELHYRFSSLCSIQEEIQAAMEMDAETEEGIQFTSYHAAKFQGEILNMKQENNKVADELQAGLDHIRGLQGEIEKVIPKILNSPSLSASKGFGTWRNTPSKSRVPLRSFLFPAKKKKSSLLACMNPALQKQHSDMAFFAKME
nr:protein NETWORKED 2A-like [Lolium perenne]